MKAQEHNKWAQSRTKDNISLERMDQLQEKKNQQALKQQKASDLAEEARLEKVRKAKEHNKKAMTRTKENLSVERT